MKYGKIDKQYTRESSIELLKIIAIIIIIISHVVQTLRKENTFIPYQNYVIDLSIATTDIQHFILVLFSHFGDWGTTIFFVCSAWFLLDSSKFKKQKWLFMLIEVWVVSIIILAITYNLRHGDISGKIIIKCLFPTTFANNWYLTCYLLFYPIHPLLNILINHLDKKSLFRLASTMFILYCCFGFIKNDLFFSSALILWITIYFVMAYMKLYLKDVVNNKKFNWFILILGIIGLVGLVIITNLLGLHISFFKNKMLRWMTKCNPFLIVMTIALFNIMRNVHFKNRFINYISSLSLLIYIIHENLILRTYYRPWIINYVYTTYGYKHIIFWVLVIVLGILLFSIISSVIYDKTIRKLVKVISNHLYPVLSKKYSLMEENVLKMH